MDTHHPQIPQRAGLSSAEVEAVGVVQGGPGRAGAESLPGGRAGAAVGIQDARRVVDPACVEAGSPRHWWQLAVNGPDPLKYERLFEVAPRPRRGYWNDAVWNGYYWEESS